MGALDFHDDLTVVTFFCLIPETSTLVLAVVPIAFSLLALTVIVALVLIAFLLAN